MSDKKSEAIKLLNEAIHELETTKGSVAIGVRKLSRATKLLEKIKLMLGVKSIREILFIMVF